MQRSGAHSDELAATILRYLESCPNACDTAEGVCQWWIPQQRFVESTHALHFVGVHKDEMMLRPGHGARRLLSWLVPAMVS